MYTPDIAVLVFLFFLFFPAAACRRAKEEVPSGVYLCSSTPGTGKTMLMDLFRESLPSHVECTRAHFRSFMLDVHAQMKQNPHSDDPMQAVARSFTRFVLPLLCNFLHLCAYEI